MPIGNVETFCKRIANIIPTLTIPSITDVELKIIKQKTTDSKGYLVAHVSRLAGQPTQSAKDNQFYIRAGDQFTIAPYEFIQRMFISQNTPDIRAIIPDDLIKLNVTTNVYQIPIGLANDSFAVGREVVCSVEVKDYKKFSSVTCSGGLKDISMLNKNKKMYDGTLDGVLHKSFNTIVGNIVIKPGRAKNALIEVAVFADRMVANVFIFKIYLYKKPRYELVSRTPKY